MAESPRTILAGVTSLLASALLSGVLDCGPDGPKTYPVRGKIYLSGSDVTHLAGSHVEAALQGEPTVRATGEIQPGGDFTLETLHAGVILTGAREGTYQVRILPTDEDSESKRRTAKAIAPRFLRFDTSGLVFQVPTRGAVTLELSPR